MSLPRQQNGGGLQGGPSGWEGTPDPALPGGSGGSPQPRVGPSAAVPGAGRRAPGAERTPRPGPGGAAAAGRAGAGLGELCL